LAHLEASKNIGTHAETRASWFRQTFSGRRGRNLREYLTGYLMILPSTVLIFIFGIFPVGFALYVSLHKWRLKQGDFLGLSNYVRAADNIAYVGLFLIGTGALIGTLLLLRRLYAQAVEHDDRPWLLLIPGALNTAVVLSFLRWIVLLLPEILDIANKILDLERTQEVFISLLVDAFQAETVVPAFQAFLGISLAALFVSIMATRLWRNPRNLNYQTQFTIIWLSSILGVLLIWFTYGEAVKAYQEALETGTELGTWSQIITIGSGIIFFLIAWIVWRSAERQESNRSFWLRIVATMVLLVGGWLLIGELPVVIGAGDKDMWAGFKVTVFYSLGTVPFQLAISLFLAVLLFQQLAGSELFRMLFFLPYVTPFVASAAVFRQMFSIRPQAPVNQLLKFFGFDSLSWIQEPEGVITLIGNSLGIDVPSWAAGPSLALVVIMLFSIWVYVGYDTVIYLAGLGNISKELTEAAEIDGASRWQIFRHIIFPLLSPTTYFLSLIAIIGTFKAFSHIWVMRHDLALGTTDTFSVTIFNEFFGKMRYGYASALAFVLFGIILILTFINNRIQGTRVFYG
jgi:ABC-type sugar transport system permease subunit